VFSGQRSFATKGGGPWIAELHLVPRWTFPIPPDYDLRSSLRCLSMAGKDPTRLRLPNGGCRKLCWIGEELCRLTIGADDKKLVVELEGEAFLADDEVRAILALDDDPSIPLPPEDPLLQLPKKVRRFRLGRVPWVFEAAVQTVLHQRVSGAEAGRSWHRLCLKFGEKWGGLNSAPSPRRILQLSSAEFASCGIESKRVLPVREAAFRLSKKPSLKTPHDEIGKSMHACRGIGVWTEQYVRGHFLGDSDAVPLGDYALPNTVAYFFEGRRKGTDDEMLRLLAPYRGNRFRVLSWLEWSGAGPPRRGARLPHGSML
jgi:3-methyladenine DNA glycosylase/8-oxoguanine DNA glycosylase